MSATKFEQTRIYFKSDFFPAVAVVDAKAPYFQAPATQVKDKSVIKKTATEACEISMCNQVVTSEIRE